MGYRGQQYEFDGRSQTVREIRERYPAYSETHVRSALEWGATDRAGLDAWDFERQRRATTAGRIAAAINDDGFVVSPKGGKNPERIAEKKRWAEQELRRQRVSRCPQ